ncbi:hypothetical protein Mgra_00005853 [Meloidogyne graminicola]|uniref:Uncharacterized protein n=1 Tax=Meloidogyne graminicola TaxID=189291 RepID=A0A8S9ZNP8_9BILA|nr:hypothetical protein Mgra_00005853 [Meloidogyne graminicola]
MRLNENNFQIVRNIHANWFATGLKALMGSLGRSLYLKLSKEEQKQLADCLNRVEDKMDLVLPANCLVNARRRHFARRIVHQIENDYYYYKLRWKRNDQNLKSPYYKNHHKINKTNKHHIRIRRMFFENIRLKKTRNTTNNLIRRDGFLGEKNEFIINNKRKEHKFEIKQQEHINRLLGRKDQSAIIRVANLISTLTTNKDNSTNSENNGNIKWTKMYEFLVNLKKENDKRRKLPGARAYNLRMYDLVLGNEEPSMSEYEKESPQGLLKLGISLLNKLTNQNITNNKIESSNFKFMSPRFAPLMPESNYKKSLFSPTIFALYENEESEEIIEEIIKVLRDKGISPGDRQALLQMLMQLSGSIGHVQKAIELLKSLNFFEIEPDLVEANKKMINAYKKLRIHLIMNRKRISIIKGGHFLKNVNLISYAKINMQTFPEELKNELERFARLDKIGREHSLWKRIERIARNIPDEFADKFDERRIQKLDRLHRGKFRLKRQVQVGQPLILAPFMFTPTIGLSVLGPLILSPSIFAPQILAPSVLSPYVLSPGAPMPFILSPFVLGPFILSPMALTPFIVLGGGILSPTVGSPEVLTESALMASVLSPSVLK